MPTHPNFGQDQTEAELLSNNSGSPPPPQFVGGLLSFWPFLKWAGMPTREGFRPLTISVMLLMLLALIAVPWQSTLAATDTCGDTGDHASRCNHPAGVMIAASDAVTTEGEGATLDFVVTLTRPTNELLERFLELLRERLRLEGQDITDLEDITDPTNVVVTMDYEIWDETFTGAAVAGTDYTDTSGTLTFAAGETTKTISVPVLDDTVSEGVETLFLYLRNASNATFVKYGQAQSVYRVRGTILPDEDTVAPTVTIATPPRVTSPVNGYFTVLFDFSEPVKGLEPSDVEITNGTLEEFTSNYLDHEHGMARWFVMVMPTPGLNGNVTIKVPAGAVTDHLGNTNTASNTFQVAARGASAQGPKPLVVCENDPDPTSWKIHGRIDTTDNVYVRFGFPDASEPDNLDLVLLPNSSDLRVGGITLTDENGVTASSGVIHGMGCYYDPETDMSAA